MKEVNAGSEAANIQPQVFPFQFLHQNNPASQVGKHKFPTPPIRRFIHRKVHEAGGGIGLDAKARYSGQFFLGGIGAGGAGGFILQAE